MPGPPLSNDQGTGAETEKSPPPVGANPVPPSSPPSGPYVVPPSTYTGTSTGNPDYRPPFPYGYPPIPRRTETQRFPVASNGKPYVVIDHPESFYGYKNDDGKQVYAAYATIQARIMAALFDTCILFLPLQTIATFITVNFSQEARRLLESMTTSPDQSQLEDISALVPGWAILAIYSVTLAYSVLCTWKWGQTLGKRVLRIKIIGKDGKPPTFQAALTRNLFGYAYGLGSVAFGLAGFGSVLGFCLQLMVIAGFTAAFFNRQRRGWHDRLAETYVVGKLELVQGENY
ncbi:MAG: RDD family protein [Chloroflexi bacterium]|nr:RDD family protein [Chloroflexota bacterium]